MKARIKNNRDSIVLYIDGKVDYESQDGVCTFITKTIEKNLKDETPRKVIVNLENLDFVGSSGITQFVQNLKIIHQEAGIAPKYCGVKSEFQKIIKAFDDEGQFEFFDDEALTARVVSKKSSIDH